MLSCVVEKRRGTRGNAHEPWEAEQGRLSFCALLRVDPCETVPVILETLQVPSLASSTCLLRVDGVQGFISPNRSLYELIPTKTWHRRRKSSQVVASHDGPRRTPPVCARNDVNVETCRYIAWSQRVLDVLIYRSSSTAAFV